MLYQVLRQHKAGFPRAQTCRAILDQSARFEDGGRLDLIGQVCSPVMRDVGLGRSLKRSAGILSIFFFGWQVCDTRGRMG